MDISSTNLGQIHVRSGMHSSDRIYAPSEPGPPTVRQDPVARPISALTHNHPIFNSSLIPIPTPVPSPSLPNVPSHHSSNHHSSFLNHYTSAQNRQSPIDHQHQPPLIPITPIFTRRSPTHSIPRHHSSRPSSNSSNALSYASPITAPVARPHIPNFENRVLSPVHNILASPPPLVSPVHHNPPFPPDPVPLAPPFQPNNVPPVPPYQPNITPPIPPIPPFPQHNVPFPPSPPPPAAPPNFFPGRQDPPHYDFLAPPVQNPPRHHSVISSFSGAQSLFPSSHHSSSSSSSSSSRSSHTVLNPSSSTSSSSSSLDHPALAPLIGRTRIPTFPPTKDIPLLTGRGNWGSWHKAVIQLIRHQGIYPHISDGPVQGAPYDPSLIPTFPPHIFPNSDRRLVDEYEQWWMMDGIASYVLESRLSEEIINCLPVQDPMAGRQTARQLYSILRTLYSVGDYTSALVIETKLRNLCCSESISVSTYVSQWRAAHNQMVTAGYPMGHRTRIVVFLQGLPQTRSYDNLRENIFLALDSTPEDQLPTMEILFERVRKLDELHTLRPHRTSTTRRSATSRLSPLNPSGATTTQPASSSSSARPTCTNCGGAHLTTNCFQAGGAMEGRKDEVLANRRQRAQNNSALQPQAHLAEANDEPLGHADEPDADTFEDLTTFNEPLAALCVEQPAPQSIVFETAYAMSAISEFNAPTISTSSTPSIDWSLAAPLLASVNSALDSGCTTHLIKDKDLFWTYNPTAASMVGTANCGQMQTLARGEVRIRLSVAGQDGKPILVTWILRNCLHAPQVPFHLLSVGQMNESGMSVHFHPKRITTIQFPDDPQRIGPLANRSVSADLVLHRISFMNLDFIRPSSTSPPIPPISAFPAYPTTVLDSELWHRRLGHPGQDLTRLILTKDVVDGISWTGPFIDMHCVACIIGKAPQTLYASNMKRADNICELIHADTCGPFPVQTPNKQRFFFVLLDDCSNYAGLELMVKKDEALAIWRKETARWENISGQRVKAIRVDGAKELVEGKFATHLAEAGVAVQQTAPYAHQQNGKIERYIRTISDTSQTLMAGSGLPPSFWGYAVRTARYL